MNFYPRINSIKVGLRDEYRKTKTMDELEAFEKLIDQIETDLSEYREAIA